MDPKQALAVLGGIGSAQEIARLSSRKKLRGAVSRGEIAHIGRSRYCLPHTAGAYAEAQASRAYLSHLSAALHHGWAVRFPPDRTTVVADLPAKARAGWATSPIRTVRDCAEALPFADALAVADSALRSGAISYESLIGAARRWPHAARTVALVADGRAANPFESSLRALAIEAGLQPIPQWRVEADGGVLHPDLADPWAGLALEADSWGHHAQSRADHDRDCERYNLLVLAGWRVLRFTWVQVMFRQDEVIRSLRWALGADHPLPTRRSVGESAA